jgi:hypothetical protein
MTPEKCVEIINKAAARLDEVTTDIDEDGNGVQYVDDDQLVSDLRSLARQMQADGTYPNAPRDWRIALKQMVLRNVN